MSLITRRDGRELRDWLIRFLFASTAVQSFDGLVQRAARYDQFGTNGLAADWLPRLWAATIDAIWYAGLLGIQRHGGRDWLSWAAFLAAFGASFGFQVIGASDVPVAAVPPVALLLVLVVMHAPRRTPRPPDPQARHGESVPAQAGSAGAVRVAAPPAPPPSTPPGPPARPVAHDTGEPARPASRPARAVRADDAALLARARQLNTAHLAAQGRPVSRDKLRAELGIGASRAERLLGQLAAQPHDGHDGHQGQPGNGRPPVPPGSGVLTVPLAARPDGPTRDGQHG